MRWLNSLVIFLGLLILSCLILIGYGFYKKAQSPHWKLWQLLGDKPAEENLEKHPKLKSTSESTASNNISKLRQINLNLPSECEVKKVSGHDKYLYITVGPTGVCHRIIIFDLSNSMIEGIIKITK